MELYKEFPIIGLRVRLYYFTCAKHFKYLPFNSAKLLSLNIYLSGLDSNEKQLDEIENSKFIGYSSLILAINYECNCKNDILQELCTALRNNEEYLKYKTKFIIKDYKFLNDTNQYFQFQLASAELYESYCKGGKAEVKTEIRQASIDYKIFLRNNINNAIFLQYSLKNVIFLVVTMDTLFHGNRPLQDIYTLGFDGIISYTTNINLYLYHINPTLSIIINNRFLNHPTFSTREGSEHDVQKLSEHLAINNMPYMLMQDLSRDGILKLIHHLESADLSVFQGVSVVIMTHGDSDGVLYADDGSVINIKTNIIQPLQNNTSLKQAFMQFLFVACRGDKLPDYMDFDDIDEVEEYQTDNSYLQRNTVVLYSVKELLKSPRHADHGAPAVTHFCQQLQKSEHNDAITKLADNMHAELRKEPFFCDLENVMECIVGPEVSNLMQEDACTPGPKVIKHGVDIDNVHEMLSVLNDFLLEHNDLDNKFESSMLDKLPDSEYVSHGIYKYTACPKTIQYYDQHAPFFSFAALLHFEELIKQHRNIARNVHNVFLEKNVNYAETDEIYIFHMWSNVLSDYLASICTWGVKKDSMQAETTFDISNLAITLSMQELFNTSNPFSPKQRFEELTIKWLNSTKIKLVQTIPRLSVLRTFHMNNLCEFSLNGNFIVPNIKNVLKSYIAAKLGMHSNIFTTEKWFEITLKHFKHKECILKYHLYEKFFPFKNLKTYLMLENEIEKDLPVLMEICYCYFKITRIRDDEYHEM